jgi:hypothetical protein
LHRKRRADRSSANHFRAFSRLRADRCRIRRRCFADDFVAGQIADNFTYFGDIYDSFSRTGLGASLYAGRFQMIAVAQSGYDSSASGAGGVVVSGGGFAQTRYQVTEKTFAIARYDGIDDSTGTFDRSLTVGAGTRVGNNFKLEFEDVIQHTPLAKHTLNVVFGFGFSNVGGSQAY